jgi:hypothetical protein
MHKEKYFLLMTLDGIDFTYCSATADRTEPESLIHEFMTLTRLKIDCIRYDGAAEFAKSATFKAFCVNNRIAMEETAAYMHTFNAIYAHLYRPADGILIDEKTGKTAACRVMAVKAYSRTQAKFWYLDFTIISHADRCDLQLPVQRGTVKSVESCDEPARPL